MNTFTISIDSSQLDSELAWLASQVTSLENLLDVVKSRLRELVEDESLIGIGKSTRSAGHVVCRPEFSGRSYEVLRSALRALNLDVAHQILLESAGTVLPPNITETGK